MLLVTAIAAGPVFLFLIFNLIARQADNARELELPAVDIEQAPALAGFLERNQVQLVAAPDDFEAKLRAGDLDVVLEVDAAFEADVAQGGQATVRLVADRSRDRARTPIAQVESLLRALQPAWGGQRLLLRGVAPDGRRSDAHRRRRPRHAATVGRARPLPRRVLRRSCRRSWAAWRWRSTPRPASASGSRSSRCS